MNVNVRDMPSLPSSAVQREEHIIVVIVDTLVAIALLTCLLRVYSCGKRLRSFAINDGFAIAAMVGLRPHNHILPLMLRTDLHDRHTHYISFWATRIRQRFTQCRIESKARPWDLGKWHCH